MSDIAARCTRATVTFGHGPTTLTALRDASCELHRGDQVVITGRSGSGKSTLLHVLAGLELPTTGTADWPAIGQLKSLRPGPVGVVFQSPSLIPSLDVLENVALPLMLMGVNRATALKGATDALCQLGVDNLALKLPEQLSGGQSQRVAVARALAHHPILIVADEPTGQLDHQSAATVIDALLAAATASDAALLVSTHDTEIAARFTEVWSITDGHLNLGEITCS